MKTRPIGKIHNKEMEQIVGQRPSDLIPLHLENSHPSGSKKEIAMYVNFCPPVCYVNAR